MLLSLKVDSDGDLVFDADGRMETVEDMEARKQRLRLRLGTQLAEWFLDTSLGVPWMQLAEKGTSQERLRAAILKGILADDEVERVLELRVGRPDADRLLSVDFVAILKGGERLSDSVEVGI